MAPRNQCRVGLTRMDAAIDHLTPMGFSPAQIRKKVYGGRVGWAFIEEGSYKLLIESILEEQEREKCALGEPMSEDLQNETSLQAVDTELSMPGPLCVTDGTLQTEQDAAPLSPQTELSSLHPGETQNSAFREDPKRRPCLGWIGPKDHDDFVLLNPMPVEITEEGRMAQGKVKLRWDEKPNHIL